jgi:protein-S-isoprenylcysteine O-methyltransferase Ste14
MGSRLFALVRSIVVAALFVALWTWFVPRWIAAGKGIALRVVPGWPIALIVVGGLIDVACFLHFGWTGLGTPFPLDPPKRFVAVYRWVRNPMYLGMALVLIGEALLLPGLTIELLVMTAILAALVALLVLFYEEPHLHQLFGAEYDAYVHAVPRWIPRVTPYSGGSVREAV